MIADRIENLVFALPEPIAAEIQKHLSGITDETFQTGKCEISSTLKALLTEYDTVPWTVSHSESHRYWQDLVILLQGSEIICSDFLEEYRAAKSYDVEQDIALYQNQAECITTVMRPGMFVLFTPEDVHHPCISNGTVSHVRKITYKIHIQKGDKFDD